MSRISNDSLDLKPVVVHRRGGRHNDLWFNCLPVLPLPAVEDNASAAAVTAWLKRWAKENVGLATYVPYGGLGLHTLRGCGGENSI